MRFQWIINQILWWLGPLFCIVGMYFLSARNTADVPKWDDFPIVGEPLLKSVEGRLTFSDLCRQEVDNRMLFPKLIHLSVARATMWRLPFETATSVTFGAFGFLILALLIKRTFPIGGFRPWLLTLLSAMFIFSMTGWMIWVYGTFLAYPLVFLLLVAKLLLFQTKLALVWKIGVGSILAFMASFSFLNGWLNWGVLAWLVIGLRLQGNISSRAFWGSVGACSLLLAASLAFYFNGYIFNSHPDLKGRLLQDPMKYVDFYFRWLGSPVGHPWPDLEKSVRIAWQFNLAWWCGLLMAVLLMIAAVLVWRNPDRRAASWPWCALGLWGLASGFLVTLGRADISAEAFFWPRYQLFTAAVYLSCVAILMVNLPVVRTKLAWLGIVPVTAFAVAWRNGVITGYSSMRNDYFSSESVHAGLCMIHAAPEPTFLNLLPNAYAKMERVALPLARLGYIRPGLLASERVADARVKSSKRFTGMLRGGQGSTNETVVLQGFAVDAKEKCPVDAVVISVQPEGGEEIWWAISQYRKTSKQVAAKHRLSRANSRVGWVLEPPGNAPTPPRKPLPKGKWTLRAYALDVENMEFHRLKGMYHGTSPEVK